MPPIATKFQQNIAAPSAAWTQLNFLSTINDLILTNFPNWVKIQEDLTTASPKWQVWEITFAGTVKAFRKAYVQISITSAFAVSQTTYTAWNTTTKTGSNGTASMAITTLIPSQNIQFTLYQNASEFSQINLFHNNTSSHINILRIANSHWLDEDSYPIYGHLNQAMTGLITPAINPFSSSTSQTVTLGIGDTTMASANPNTGIRDVLNYFYYKTPNNSGMSGWSSVLTYGCCSGLTKFLPVNDTASGSTIKADVLNNVAGGLLIYV